MSKTFSGNSFRFRTPSKSTTKFHFDDNQLELDTNTVKMNTIQCNSIQDRNGYNKFSFNGNTCDLHGMDLINGNFYSEYITPLYYTGSGNIELTTDGNLFTGTNRFSTDINTVQMLRISILVKKVDMSRVGSYTCDLTLVNNNNIITSSNTNILNKLLIGDHVLINLSTDNKYLVLNIDTGIDTLLCKAFIEMYIL